MDQFFAAGLGVCFYTVFGQGEGDKGICIGVALDTAEDVGEVSKDQLVK